MPLTTYNCTALTGGAARALDSYSVEDLANGDRALCAVGGLLLYFMFDATATDAEDVTNHPYKVRPDDYVDQGVWIEQEAVINPVTADAVITDNHLIKGDGGARGAQKSTIIVSDDGEMTNPSQPAFQAHVNTTQTDVTGDGTNYPITGAFFTERYDQGNNFANGVFTASVTGKHTFFIIIYITGIATAHTQLDLILITSNKSYYLCEYDPTSIHIAGACMLNEGFQVDMDINDTAQINFVVSNGTKVVDVLDSYTIFAGKLDC